MPLNFADRNSPHGRRPAVSERPTPETDNNDYAHAFLEQYGYESSLQDAPVDWADFARRLERERDDLKDQLAAAMMSIRLQQRREQQANEQP